MTEHGCEDVVDAVNAIDDNQVDGRAKQALSYVKSTDDLWKLLTEGINLKQAKDNKWFHLPTLSNIEGAPNFFGLLARNYPFSTEEALSTRDIGKAGIIILVKDRVQNEP